MGLGALIDDGGSGGGGKIVVYFLPPSREKTFSRGLRERVRGCECMKEGMFRIFPV